MPDLFALADLGRAALEVLALPVAVWTVVALAAEAALRLTKASAALALPVRGSVLAALPLAVLAPLALSALVPQAAVAVAAWMPEVTWLPGVSVGAPAPERSALGPDRLHLLAGVTVGVAMGLAAVRLTQFGLAVARAVRLRHTLPVAVAESRATIETARHRLGVARAIGAAQAPPGAAPFTLGWRRPVVALPPDLTPEAREVAAVHEVAHVRRSDYAWHAAQRAVAAAFAAHPLVAVLAQGLDLDRERAADAAVLAACPGHRRAYADLLFSYAALPAPPLALGAVGGSSALKSRIEAMTTPLSPARTRRLARAGRLVGLVAVALVSGLAATTAPSPSAPTPPDDDPAALVPVGVPQTQGTVRRDTTDVVEIADEMPEIIGGLASVTERVRYPELQRRAGVEGTAILHFIVTKEGAVEDLVIARSSGNDGLDQAAMAAVRPTRFTPGRVDGEPVRVRFALPITFRLPADAPEDTAEAEPQPTVGDPEGTPDVQGVVDEMPQLLGGLAGLQARVEYPPLAMGAGIEGQVIVQFIVNEAGAVEDAIVLRSPHDMLSEAALRAVRQARFEPGRQAGEAVKVRFAVPITFRLPVEEGDGDRGEARPAESGRTDGTLRYSGLDVTRLTPTSRRAFEGTLAEIPTHLAESSTTPGTAVVQYTIDGDGRVTESQIVRGAGPLADAATFLVGTLRTAENARPGPSGSWTGTFRLVYTGEG